MRSHLRLRRAMAWADRLIHPRRLAPPLAPAAAPAATDLVAEPTAGAAAEPASSALPGRSQPGAPCPTSAVPLDAHHQQGLAFARAHRWNWAQRELEVAVRAAPHGAAQADLESVRAVRRQLRLLQKWPRDVAAHVALGRAYFELELGAEAEAAFRQAIALAPREPAAYVLLALEYLYRGAMAEAECVYTQAQALDAGLEPWAAVLAGWQAGFTDVADSSVGHALGAQEE